MLKLWRIPVLIALGAGLALASCGGDDDKSSGSAPSPPAQQAAAPAGGETLKLTADKDGALKFDKDALSAGAGSVEVVMDNPAQVPHNIAIDGNGVDQHGEVVDRGGRSTVALDLKPGTYAFYCSVDGHREAGMEGKLTVR